MSEPMLRSPLHDSELSATAKPADSSAGVWANEVANLGYIGLRGRATDEAFLAAAQAALGFALPAEPCTHTASGKRSAFWLSPDEWLITGPRAENGTLIRSLNANLAGIRSQVVDTSGGYTQIELRGRDAHRVLAHVSVYAIEKLAPGRVAGTTLGKSSAYIFRNAECYRLIIRRSFADYIWRFLERAASPYGFGIVQIEDRERGPRP